ncbi:MAG: AraC family transcriptional regulator [Pseudomonadota bacterium]
MSERLFPISIISAAVSYAARFGVNADILFQRAGVPPQVMADPEALITVGQYHEMAVQAQALLGDPAFALHLGEWLRVETAEVIGTLYLTAPTVRASLLQCVRFMPLVTPCVDAALEEDGNEARYYCLIAPSLADDFRFLYAEATLSITWHLIRTLTGRPDINPVRIRLRHDGSARLAEFRRLFGSDVVIEFNAGEDVTVFDRSLLDVPNAGNSPTVHAQMETLALARLAKVPSVETASTSVLRLLEVHTGRDVLDLEQVAERLGTTARTLQRRLRDENTSFQKLRDGLRYRQAQSMLRDERMDVATIAATLGFSEPTTFHRAFKSWSGLSPTEFRRRHGGNE